MVYDNGTTKNVFGVGLGLRRPLIDYLNAPQFMTPQFLELAPENWIGLGGQSEADLHRLAESYPIILHGLSLSLGSPDPIDRRLLSAIKHFMSAYTIPIYSEHLSFSGANGHLYDLLPLPFTQTMVKQVVGRINAVQELLNVPLVIENIASYAQSPSDMTEIDFFMSVVEKSGCEILLDVNNVYVNSINHQFDARKYISALPSNRIRYMHIAGHYKESESLLIDTHGTAVCHEVWDLLAFSYACHGVKPTVLERDFNLPVWDELSRELISIAEHQEDAINSLMNAKGARSE